MLRGQGGIDAALAVAASDFVDAIRKLADSLPVESLASTAITLREPIFIKNFPDAVLTCWLRDTWPIVHRWFLPSSIS